MTLHTTSVARSAPRRLPLEIDFPGARSIYLSLPLFGALFAQIQDRHPKRRAFAFHYERIMGEHHLWLGRLWVIHTPRDWQLAQG